MSKEMTLGQLLKQYRNIGGYTLRQVEDATGVSNAYLSQLENDKIKNPSANVLYKLAQMYSVELESLLAASGIIMGQPAKAAHILAPIAKVDLTKGEEEQLLEYLQFLRFRKRQRPTP
jgi:transcriptional regulator with XRE-family HTH domain